MFLSASNWTSTKAFSKLFLFAFLAVWQVAKKSTSMPFNETIGELGYIMGTSLNGRELCREESLCLRSFSIKKENTGSEELKTKGVLKWGSKLLFCLEKSSVCHCVDGRTFLLFKKVGFMMFFTF